MIIKGRIQDIDDIQQNSYVREQTGEVIVSGTFLLSVKKPSQVIKVKVSPELWKDAQNGKTLEEIVDKELDFWIEQREFNFTRPDGQTVSGSNNNLFALPVTAK
ncbi:conserved hypothetical protein [Vibrio nigripulchritudo FTn2]|uniref:hypothetical protein n=1 Tax=Vibrio nigripulchritudo TaxID=28173 RepID=UPI0003B22C7A|nr:hypothetical protein [Vibrio nigripulchritudo]CCN40363.1 conserved hypothetical protein [Vibrio nigripulchritudo FTn2]